MLLPKGGVTWKSAKARLPPWRAFIVYLTKVRVLAAIALTGLILLLWRGISVSTKDLSKFVALFCVFYRQRDTNNGYSIAVIIASGLPRRRRR